MTYSTFSIAKNPNAYTTKLIFIFGAIFVNQLSQVVSFLEKNLEKYNLEWINTGRVSDDWKAKIFGHKLYKRQIGVYNRETIILVRLENYDTNIAGVVKQDKMPKSHALDNASFSRFRDSKGVCVKVDTLESFKVLLNWYFPNAQN